MAYYARNHPYYTAGIGAGTLGAAGLAYRHRDAIRGYDYGGKAKGALDKVSDWTWRPVYRGVRSGISKVRSTVGLQRRRRSRRVQGTRSRRSRRRRRSRRSRR